MVLKKAHIVNISYKRGFVNKIVLALIPDICSRHKVLVTSLGANSEHFLSIGILFILINYLFLEEVTLVVNRHFKSL